MADVVALDLPAGPDFVVALQRVWDAGAVAFPVDERLPAAERDLLFDAVRPTHRIDPDLERTSLPGGRGADDGDALVVATSGTTGRPKGVVLTHDAVRASGEATSAALDVDPATDHWLACLPPAHVGGLSVITRALHTGTPLTTLPRFDPERVVSAVDAGVTLASFVTRALVQVPTERFRRILVGGAAPPPDRPENVIATYGMTETGSGIVYERRTLDGVDLRIDDDGQILVRGPMLLRAYRSGADDIDPFLAGGWFPTGDLGSLGDDGRLMVEGRAGEVIVTGGEKVWPTRTEAVLHALAGVDDAAVVGVPDPDWGSRVVALVVPGPDGGPTLEEIRTAVRHQLPVWYAPREIRTVSSIPRTALGKIRRSALSGAADANRGAVGE